MNSGFLILVAEDDDEIADILMSYLRIKSTLGDNLDLIRQLNLIFENDVNFLNFKI